jgi:acetylglutamate kinase
MEKTELFVVKIGGNVIDNQQALDEFLTDFSKIKQRKILVHGGGKIATEVAEKLGFKALMVEGRRITDENMLNVVTMVYGGLINKKIVAKLQSLQCKALGLTGADAGIIQSQKRPVNDIDYGYVGDIIHIEKTILNFFLDADLTPVLAPLTYDIYGNILNTNADTIASEVAVHMAIYYNVNLLYCFELNGVLEKMEEPNSVIPLITFQNFDTLKKNGIISKGMIPKIENALKAIQKGVNKVHICHAKHVIPISNHHNVGTIIQA